MKTLYKLTVSVVVLGVLNGCAVYPPNRYYSSSGNYYGRGHHHGNQGYGYANNGYQGYRNPYPMNGYSGYQQRPYCPDDD